jgi:hypothetical protein
MYSWSGKQGGEEERGKEVRRERSKEVRKQGRKYEEGSKKSEV